MGSQNGGALVPAKRDLRALLERAKPEMSRVLPRHLTPDRMASLALLACTVNPDLLQCEPQSVVRAVMQAAALGLEINGPLGHAYLVRYGKMCTLIPGYRGLIHLAKNGGGIAAGEARLVYAGELFEVDYGTEPKIQHKPRFDVVREKDNIVAAYFVARLPDGEKQFEVMNLAEIKAIKSRSKAASSGPWVSDFGEMARKTVTRRALKYIPMVNPEEARKLGEAMELDARFETGAVGGVLEGDTEETLSAQARVRTEAKMEDLKDRIGAGRDVTDVTPPAGPAETPPDPRLSLIEAIGRINPRGGTATDGQREEIRRLAAGLFEDGEAARESLFALSEDERLGKNQAGILIGHGREAEAAFAPGADDGADTPADPFEAEEAFQGELGGLGS